MNRRLKIVLAASVVLNVLLAGVLLGGACHHYMEPQAFDMSARLARLPADKRALFESIMGPAKAEMDAEHKQMDEAKQEALRLLKAEPFNEQAYLAQVRHLNDLHDQTKRHVSEAVVALAKQLNSQERGILAEIISHPPFSMPPGSLLQARPDTRAL